VSIFKKKQAHRETDYPRDDEKARNCCDRSDRAPHLRPDADGNANNVRPGHELTKADDVGKFSIADPAALLDGNAARPNDAAGSADAVERNGKERGKQRGEGNGLLQLLSLRQPCHFDRPGSRSLRPFTRAHVGGGDAGPDGADVYAEPAGAGVSGYAALRPDRIGS